MDTKQFILRLNADLHKKFMLAVRTKDTSGQQVLNRCVENFVKKSEQKGSR